MSFRDDQVKGYILFRQANLSSSQEDQLTTWTTGKYGRKEVVSALRGLEKVTKEKHTGKSYATEGDILVDEGQEDSSNDEYVYIGEHDLSEVFEEADIQEALATYQQVRQAIREQKVGREYFNLKGSSKGGSSASSSTFRKSEKVKVNEKGTKVHVDVLKLRTRCARCGQIGHWAKECTNEADGKRREKSRSSTGKSGFFESGEKCSSQSTCMHVTLGQFMRRREHCEEFTGLTTGGAMGIVDAAGQGGLMGNTALERLQRTLHERGLWRRGQARGIGGEARVCGVVEVPIGVSGTCGAVEATVVEEEVPFLLSIRVLRDVEAVVNVAEGYLHMQRFGVKSMLQSLPSGHIAVSVVDFPGGRFQGHGQKTLR